MTGARCAGPSPNPYSLAAAAFDRATGDYGDETKQRVVFPLVLQHLGEPAAAPALDVGCGNGAFVRFAARAGRTVDGIDASPELLELARARDRRLGVRGVYADADVTSAAASAVMRPYDVFTCVFALQDVEGPRRFLHTIVRGRDRPFRLVVVNESWYGLTSRRIEHHVPRRIVPSEGRGDALALSIADWGSGECTVTYCRPERYYRRLFRDAGLAERSFGFFGMSRGTPDVVQRFLRSRRPFWAYAGVWSPAC